MSSALPKPPFDVELALILKELPLGSNITTVEEVQAVRRVSNLTADQVLRGRAVEHEEHTIEGPGGDLIISIFRPSHSTKMSGAGRPGIFFVHGGGLISGNRFFTVSVMLDWVEECGAIGASVEYRLAPEHPQPAQIEDCYAGLVWMGQHALELGLNPRRLVIAGGSAGGGLTAGLALLNRDRGGPELCAQVMMAPMLDERSVTVSSRQYFDSGSWTGPSNQTAWKFALGETPAGQVSIYAVPRRATDLSRLPPAFIDVGSADPFRDEAVAYATSLWGGGVQTELHVWPGGWHGFDCFAPDAQLSRIARKTRLEWLRRVLDV